MTLEYLLRARFCEIDPSSTETRMKQVLERNKRALQRNRINTGVNDHYADKIKNHRFIHCALFTVFK